MVWFSLNLVLDWMASDLGDGRDCRLTEIQLLISDYLVSRGILIVVGLVETSHLLILETEEIVD
jgi:hypothetical protein